MADPNYNPYKDLNKIPGDVERAKKSVEGWFTKKQVKDVISGKDKVSSKKRWHELGDRQPIPQQQPPVVEEVSESVSTGYARLPTGPDVAPSVDWSVPRGFPPGDAYHAVKDYFTEPAPVVKPAQLDFMQGRGPVNAAGQAPNVVINVGRDGADGGLGHGDHAFGDEHVVSDHRSPGRRYKNIIEQAQAEGIPTAQYQMQRAARNAPAPDLSGQSRDDISGQSNAQNLFDQNYMMPPLAVEAERGEIASVNANAMKAYEDMSILEQANMEVPGGWGQDHFALQQLLERDHGRGIIGQPPHEGDRIPKAAAPKETPWESVFGVPKPQWAKDIKNALVGGGPEEASDDVAPMVAKAAMSPLGKDVSAGRTDLAPIYENEGDSSMMRMAERNAQATGAVGALVDRLPGLQWSPKGLLDWPEGKTPQKELLHPINLPTDLNADERARYIKVYDAAFGEVDPQRSRIQATETARVSDTPGIMRSELPSMALGHVAGAGVAKIIGPLFRVLKGVKLPRVVSYAQLKKMDKSLDNEMVGMADDLGFGANSSFQTYFSGHGNSLSGAYGAAYGLTPKQIMKPGALEAAIKAERARLLSGKAPGIGLTEKEILAGAGEGSKTLGSKLSEAMGGALGGVTDFLAPTSTTPDEALAGHSAFPYSPHETEKAYDQRLLEVLSEKMSRFQSGEGRTSKTYPITSSGLVSDYPVEEAIEPTKEDPVEVEETITEEALPDDTVEEVKSAPSAKGTIYENAPARNVKPKGTQMTPTQSTGKIRLANAVTEAMTSDNYFETMFNFLKTNQETGLVKTALGNRALRRIAHNTGVKWYNWFIDKQSKENRGSRISWDKQLQEMGRSANKAILDEIEGKRKRGEKLEDDELRFKRDMQKINYKDRLSKQNKKRGERDYTDFLTQWKQNPSAHLADIAIWTMRDQGVANYLANMQEARSSAKSGSSKQLRDQAARITTIAKYQAALARGDDIEADRISEDEIDQDDTLTQGTDINVLRKELEKYRKTALDVAVASKFNSELSYNDHLKNVGAEMINIFMKSDDPDILDYMSQDPEAKDLIFNLIRSPKGHNLSPDTFYKHSPNAGKKKKRRR